MPTEQPKVPEEVSREIETLALEHLARCSAGAELHEKLLIRIRESAELKLAEGECKATPVDQVVKRVYRDEAVLAAGVLATAVVRGKWRGLQEADASDVVQEVQRVILDDLEHGRDEFEQFEGYVFYTTLGALKGQFRRKVGEPKPGHDGPFDDLASTGGGSPEESASSLEFSKALADCLNRLPAKDRELLRRRLILEVTPKQLAKEMNKNVSTVRVRLFRLMAKLRECLKNKGFDPHIEEPQS